MCIFRDAKKFSFKDFFAQVVTHQPIGALRDGKFYDGFIGIPLDSPLLNSKCEKRDGIHKRFIKKCYVALQPRTGMDAPACSFRAIRRTFR
jgi:hypothetical protein